MMSSRSHPASMNPTGAPKPISLMTSYARNLDEELASNGTYLVNNRRGGNIIQFSHGKILTLSKE